VVVALECSTFSTLMDAAAFEKLGQPDWLQQPPGVVSICILVASWRCRQEQSRGCLCCYHVGGSVPSLNLQKNLPGPWSVDLQLGWYSASDQVCSSGS